MLTPWFVAVALGLTAQMSKIKGQTQSTAFSDMEFTDAAFQCGTCWYAAAIHMTGTGTSPEMTITGCVFSDNSITATNYKDSDACGGGAVYCNTITLLCEQTTFTRCHALIGKGGAIYADVNAPMTIKFCNFTSCTSEAPDKTGKWGGGALYSVSAKITTSNCTFDQCQVGQNDGSSAGGAILGLTIKCLWCDFLLCTSYGSGGAISLGLYDASSYGTSLDCERCIFNECSTENQGGAVMIASQAGTRSTLVQCTLSACSSAEFGAGGIHMRGVATNGLVSLIECIFDDCTTSAESRTAHAILVDGNDYTDYNGFHFSLDTCTFSTGSGGSSGVPIVSVSWGTEGTPDKETFDIRGCTFTGETKQMCVQCPSSYTGDWVLEGCKFIRNTLGNREFFSIQPRNARYVNCHFEDNTITGRQKPIVPMVADGSYSFEECTFSGWTSGTSILHVAVTIGSMSITGCTFNNCHSTGASGIVGSLADNCPSVTIERTTFHDCSGQKYLLELKSSSVKFNANEFYLSKRGDGSYIALSLGSDEITIEDCVFSVTGDDTPAAPFLDITSTTTSLAFQNCSFVGIKTVGREGSFNPSLGQDGTLTFTNCTFRNLQCEGTSTEAPNAGNGNIIFTDCQFEECTSTASFSHVCGVYFSSQGKLSILSSNFTSSQGPIINIIFQKSEIIFENVSFDSCQSNSNIISITPTESKSASEESCVNLSICTFSDCHVSDSTSPARLLIEAVSSLVFIKSDSVGISDSVFEGCSSSSGKIVNLECQHLSVARNTISGSGGLSVALTGEASFEDTLFHATETERQVAHPLMDMTCPTGVFIQFYNCCFTHASEAEPASAPLFLKMSVSGTVVFSQVCFDVVEDKAVLFEEKDGANITFVGVRENFFGDKCQCWTEIAENPDTEVPSETIIEVDSETVTGTETESDDVFDTVTEAESDGVFDTVTEAESDDVFDTVTEAESDGVFDTVTGGDDKTPGDDGSGGGDDDDKSTIKIVVGVVVAVVVVAVVVFLVIFFLRRRRNQSASSEVTAEEMDTTEETAVTHDMQGDLGVTESMPMSTNGSVFQQTQDDGFDAFEEMLDA